MNPACPTFHIRTFGCQMNKHDAERVAGMLSADGMRPADSVAEADVVVFLTCCVRENADDRLEGTVASLKALKDVRPEVLIAVGGCIGQRDGRELLRALPHVDVVFGTHNLGRLPSLLAAARESALPVVEVLDGTSEDLRKNEDVKEFYMGLGELGRRKSYREVKRYKRRKRWLG